MRTLSEKFMSAVFEMFDNRIQTLKDRGCPSAIVTLSFEQQKFSIASRSIEVADKMSFKDEHILFFPVIPRTYRGLYDLMEMVWYRSNEGHIYKGSTYLNPTLITDEVETPNKPYYIFDVDDGKVLRGKSPKEAIDIIKKQSRSPLTVAEVIALATHTDILFQPNEWEGECYGYEMCAAGSCYRNTEFHSKPQILSIFMSHDIVPELYSGDPDYGNCKLGIPSCSSRYVAE